MWLKKGYVRRSRIEMPGCYNTGFAPAIAHKNLPLLQTSFYVVGHEADVTDSTMAAYRCLCGNKRSTQQTVTGRKAYVYKGMTSARRKFECARKPRNHVT